MKKWVILLQHLPEEQNYWGYSDTVQVSPAAAVNFHSDFLSFLLLLLRDHVLWLLIFPAHPCCVLHSPRFQGHAHKAKHNLSTRAKLIETQEFSYFMWPGMFCLFLLEAIWRAKKQKLALFSSLHSTFNTPTDSFGIMAFVTGVLSWDKALGKN